MSDSAFTFFTETPGGLVCQGLSTGGYQRGLGDARSSLIRQVFVIFDGLPLNQRQDVLKSDLLRFALFFKVTTLGFVFAAACAACSKY